jgi:hypothetical protein
MTFIPGADMLPHRIYYQIKPFIPRSLQIVLRRGMVILKRKLNGHIWPIDEKAGKPPKGWPGWPEGKKFALVLLHDVDTEKGQIKCQQLIEIDEEMGFKSVFNLVPERYNVSPDLRKYLVEKGFEVAVHGLKHDGKLFITKERFQKQAIRINHYLKEWQSVGFVSPSMHRNFEWMHELKIEYAASTFDTDPFEPQPHGIGTIFPFWVSNDSNDGGYIELPYTMAQDFTLFVLMREKNINIWKRKLDWIAENGGMALLITHPDYMSFDGKRAKVDEYPSEYYKEFLEYVILKYKGQYWNVLPRNVAQFWKSKEEVSKI